MASSLTPDDYGRWVHRSEKYHYPAESGASSFDFYNYIEGALPPTEIIGSVNGIGSIPTISANKEISVRLQRYCDGDSVKANLSVELGVGRSISHNVKGTVGPDTDEKALFTVHIDGHDVGSASNDNGFGTAMVVEVGKMLAQIATELETKVRLIVSGAEETNLYGSYYWSYTHDLDDVKYIVTVDDVLENDAISLAAVLAGQDSGSARQVLKLLFKVSDFPCSHNESRVTEDLVREVDEIVQRGEGGRRVSESSDTEPPHLVCSV